MKSWHIHIGGLVQGVGFRPFVYGLAQKEQLSGWINNGVDGVHIEVNATHDQLTRFHEAIKTEAPDVAQIDFVDTQEIESKQFSSFQIIESNLVGAPSASITPDFGLCSKCKSELMSPANRRHQYPFITCIHCGPRYSILKAVPFDRDRTSMQPFSMCPDCLKEYRDPSDRRHHSQTNTCPTCAIHLSYHPSISDKQETDIIVKKVCEFWSQGKIVAIKGIGGFLLTTPATDAQAVCELRKRKRRPSKPFAIMAPDLESVEKIVELEPALLKELSSPTAPISIAKSKASSDIFSGVAPGLDQLGVMLPYAPLFHMLLTAFNQPIVATSANVSSAPIIYDNDRAQEQLGDLADLIIYHDREIVNPQDDSVIRHSQHRRIIIRRARGLAPTYMHSELQFSSDTIFATGAMLKSTCALMSQKKVYISQYIGDLQDYQTEASYEKISQQLLNIFAAQPNLILSDAHPDYPSTRFGATLAQNLSIPIKYIPHHLAHFASILGEHNLLHERNNVLGVIWDGLGLGDDGQIWGGEFFTYGDYQFARTSHLNYFPYLAKDKMSSEPRLSALSLLHHFGIPQELIRDKFSTTEWRIYQKLLDNWTGIWTSSIGRLFDAVASLLDLSDRQSYEGEAAMQLERLATQFLDQDNIREVFGHLSDLDLIDVEGRMNAKGILTQILQDLNTNISKSEIAAKYHCWLVLVIEKIATTNHLKQVAFSGGVFQNALLVDLIIDRLGDQCDLYFHEQLSPNDENISFGQLIYEQISRHSDHKIDTMTNNQQIISNSVS